jgi:hypothetical protein
MLADFATVWSELFPAEQARIDVQEDAPGAAVAGDLGGAARSHSRAQGFVSQTRREVPLT